MKIVYSGPTPVKYIVETQTKVPRMKPTEVPDHVAKRLLAEDPRVWRRPEDMASPSGSSAAKPKE